jgi:hypothetical protein
MTYENFIEKIVESKIDQWIYDDDLGLYIFRNDISITIQRDKEKHEDNDFNEPWVKKYSDPKGYKQGFFLRYNGTLIEKFYTVSVDGYRMYIPYPKSSTDLTINKKKYNIGKIVNIVNSYNFDEYLRSGNIEKDF